MNLAEIIDNVLSSKKYSGISRGVVERVCADCAARYSKPKDVIKAAKKELHIIHESFLRDNCHLKAGELLNVYSGSGMAEDKDFARKLMGLHASTHERIVEVDEIYAFLSRYINEDDCVADVGCGFNPFALPFLRNKPKGYMAYDINSSTKSLLNTYFEITNEAYKAELIDAAVNLPQCADVTLIFKLFPLLERQKKGRGFELINSLFGTIIVSFPTKSASGKEKGMEGFYSTMFEGGLPSSFSIEEKIMFKNEMFYVLNKK